MTQLTQEQFLKDVANHQITINLDQGVYRDITISRPNSIVMHYNITTRPDHLMITGDMGSFIFKRLDDMFQFFRCEDGCTINPSYWGEKLHAESMRSGYKQYDEKKAKQALQEWFADFVSDLESDDEDYLHKIDAARSTMDDIDYSDEYSFVESIRGWHEDSAGGMDLTDFFEVSVDSYTFNYIWCCYAIVHAIKLYDEVKGEATS